MLLPEPTARGRMRFFLQTHGMTQSELATFLGITGARVSQLINGPGLKTEHIKKLSAEFPGFSASYYLDGFHTIDKMGRFEGGMFQELPPPYCMVYRAMKTYQKEGWPTATYLTVGVQAFKAMLSQKGEVYVQRGFMASLQAGRRIPLTGVSTFL